jgi:N-acyl-D-aspartate/D-glutamate deacylase
MNDRCELLIRNGLLFDGINPGRRLDVAISDGRIVAIARHLRMEAEREIDAAGMWVTPGFIDIHTHYDLEVEIAPALSESVRHGVTTVVIGGCSLSTTYGAPEDLADIFSRVETLPKDLIEPWLRKAEPRRKAREYFDHLAELKLGPNVAAMLGHSTLRVAVMGLERSLRDHATPQELREMRKLAEQALEAGCIGISVDMVHWHKVNGAFAGRALPSHHAALEEYEMLAQVCRNRDAVFQVTPNPENPRTVLDIIGLSTGIWRAPLRNTILSALDMDRMPHLWRFYGPLLFVCNQLLGCNIKLQTLPEPFVIYADGHITPFFEEFSAGVKLNNCKDREARRLMWRDPAFRQEFFDNWKSGRATFHRDLNGMYIVSCPDDKLVGRSIAAVARQAGVDPLEYFATLLERYDELLRWKACSANARDTIRHKLLRHRHILPGFSDAGAHSRNLAFFDSALTVLRQAVQFNVMPIERAIRRITSEPAAWFNLQAGVLAPGSRADINVIDPERLRQPVPAPKCVKDEVLQGAARMVKRDRIPAVRHVFIKGVEVVRHGMPLDALGAKRLG